MSNPRFDLVDIVQTLRKHFRLILIVTVVAAIIGVSFHFLRKKEFTAEAQFFVSNPLLGDRNTLYGGADSRMDYFGDEDDVDRVLALAESDTVIMKVLDRSGLAHDMDKDLIDAKNIHDMKKVYMNHVKLKRTEYMMIEVEYTNEDPFRAARVANTIVGVLEESYRNFYNSHRKNIYNSLQKKFAEQDSVITALTDSLALIRDRSGIYDLVSPNRLNMITSVVHGKSANMGMDLERIQNIEALKDAYVIDQTRVSSLLQQFSTGEQDMQLLHIISRARQPIVPKGPNGVLTLIISCLLGFFFSAFYVLISTYYKKIVAVDR